MKLLRFSKVILAESGCVFFPGTETTAVHYVHLEDIQLLDVVCPVYAAISMNQPNYCSSVKKKWRKLQQFKLSSSSFRPCRGGSYRRLLLNVPFPTLLPSYICIGFKFVLYYHRRCPIGSLMKFITFAMGKSSGRSMSQGGRTRTNTQHPPACWMICAAQSRKNC